MMSIPYQISNNWQTIDTLTSKNIEKRGIACDGEMGNRKNDIIDHFVLNEQKRQRWLK
jgi:hypothetical protein